MARIIKIPRFLRTFILFGALLILPTLLILWTTSPSSSTYPGDASDHWDAGGLEPEYGTAGVAKKNGRVLGWDRDSLGLGNLRKKIPVAKKDAVKGKVAAGGGVIMQKMGNETAKAELGRASWKLLHTMTLRFPDEPTPDERAALKTYFHLFGRLYPCGECASEFQQLLKEYPPQTSSRKSASLWLCSLHNIINARLQKPEFDCLTLDATYDCGCGDDASSSSTTAGGAPEAKGVVAKGAGKKERERARPVQPARVEAPKGGGGVGKVPNAPGPLRGAMEEEDEEEEEEQEKRGVKRIEKPKVNAAVAAGVIMPPGVVMIETQEEMDERMGRGKKEVVFKAEETREKVPTMGERIEGKNGAPAGEVKKGKPVQEKAEDEPAPFDFDEPWKPFDADLSEKGRGIGNDREGESDEEESGAEEEDEEGSSVLVGDGTAGKVLLPPPVPKPPAHPANQLPNMAILPPVPPPNHIPPPPNHLPPAQPHLPPQQPPNPAANPQPIQPKPQVIIHHPAPPAPIPLEEMNPLQRARHQAMQQAQRERERKARLIAAEGPRGNGLIDKWNKLVHKVSEEGKDASVGSEEPEAVDWAWERVEYDEKGMPLGDVTGEGAYEEGKGYEVPFEGDEDEDEGEEGYYHG